LEPAISSSDTPVQIKTIAQQQDISVKYLDGIGICIDSKNRQYAQIVISSEVEKSV